jgi:small GTP-binding protein
MKMRKDSSDTKISYNFLILGDKMVGKTSILERYVNNNFNPNYITTIGMDKRIKRIEINNCDITIFVIDTAGQERFRSLSKSFYKQADAILIGFSLTDKTSLNNINFWFEEINNYIGKESPIGLVLFGNKCDDKINIEVNPDDITPIINKYNLTYFETSAKTNIHIQELFEYLIKATIMKKGHLKRIGLDEKSTFDDIHINIKENQRLEVKKKKVTKKKKKFC